ncbi:MAG: pyrroline-5-carboxylate reductase dimerization domain-containing protein, partial [Pirellulaceae bacterium]|nr:pyrroline-5-carboxylate reductase dimerization domain-containing protein [Pirellulaceae bacterium]
GSVGDVALVDESQMDVVTGLSGSGPAYVFSFIEALMESGVENGLSVELAQQLTLQTLKGAVALVEATGQSPHFLREQVTSPGGTTLAGLTALEDAGFASAVKNAVKAASARSRELSA